MATLLGQFRIINSSQLKKSENEKSAICTVAPQQ